MAKTSAGPFRQVVRWLPAIAWMALLFVASATPDLRFSPDDLTDTVVRKTGHVGVYLMLGVLVLWAIGPRRRAAWLAFAVCLAYAVSDEAHQGLVTGRHPSPIDVAIDATGAAAGVVIAATWRRLRQPGQSSAG